MESKSEQMLRNPEIEPSYDVIATALGEANNAYIEFIGTLASHDIHIDWRYYNDGKAWLAKGLFNWTGARGGQHETTVFWLSIWDGFFKVTIYVPEKFRSDVMNLPLNHEVKRMIDGTPQMGKLKYFPVVFDMRSNEQFAAVFLLADFRKYIK
ncbi:DUF3788 family protein [Proteiniclasticum sp. SCR006]|uniref:DUF3788 family protein n=1 Tax=Proteiniclasticum aestuarii TaxID=2817862 RepID=A0A939KKB1_9CLOT|nr:DUF3788 family protein [Proteiniclasticum aestuarii]MBO1265906.1 DUF3788 family protein [Proteiniclasticum aestuarii]